MLEDDRQLPTFKEAAEKWLVTYSHLSGLRISTRALYRHTLEAYAFPRFGAKLVDRISREDIRLLVADLLAARKSRSLVRNVAAPIRQTFNQLIEDGLVGVNPAARIGRFLKGKDDARQRVDPLTPEEEAKFLDTALVGALRYYPLFLCALRTGPRFGELAGLQWGDIDFAIRRVDMSRQLTGDRNAEEGLG